MTWKGAEFVTNWGGDLRDPRICHLESLFFAAPRHCEWRDAPLCLPGDWASSSYGRIQTESRQIVGEWEERENGEGGSKNRPRMESCRLKGC